VKRQPASNRSVKEPKLSRAHPPVDLAPADWQRALRRQFGRDQAFVLENRGDQPFFSEFRVSNPQSKAIYRVAIRGLNAGDNDCSCPDYATNELGTCKHIEFVLARLEKKRGRRPPLPGDGVRRFPRSTCATTARARCSFALDRTACRS
jgi:hypothetical protein